MAIEDTPQYKIAKITIAEKLTEELQENYNRILSFQDIVNPMIISTQFIMDNLSISEDFDTHLDNFVQNLNDYIPNVTNNPDGSNVYLESLQSILTDSFSDFHEDSDIFSLLGANTLDEIQNLTQLDPTFIESITTNLMSGTFQNILTDFNLDEFRLGSIFSVVQHNLGLFDIPNSLSNIVSISENLINNFSDVANLEFVNNLLGSIPQTFSNLFLDKFGNLSIGGILESFGIPGISDILNNVLNINGILGSVIGSLTGQLSSLLGGGGLCGCIIGIGLSNLTGFLGNIAGSLGNLTGVITGTLNSTIGNILSGTPIGDFLDVGSITGAITGQLNFIKDPSTEWADAPTDYGDYSD